MDFFANPLRELFYKFGFREGLPRQHPQAKFHRCGFKYVSLQPPKLVIFGINFPQRGISP